MIYAIDAVVNEQTKQGIKAIHIPTFYLLDNVQGDPSVARAERIAERIVNPTGTLKTHISAFEVDGALGG